MRYTTYNSIYVSTSSEAISHTQSLLVRLTKSVLFRLISIMFVLWLSGTGIITVLADEGNTQPLTEKVVVEPGDTLWGIAVSHKPKRMDPRVYIEAIKHVNGLKESGVRAGQVLYLP